MKKENLIRKVNKIMKIGLTGLVLATSTIGQTFPIQKPLNEVSITEEKKEDLREQYVRDYEFCINNDNPMTAAYTIFNSIKLNLNIPKSKEKIKKALSKLEEKKEYLHAAVLGLEFNLYLDTKEEVYENTDRCADNYKKFAEFLIESGSKSYDGRPGRGIVSAQEYLEKAKELYNQTGNGQGIIECDEILNDLRRGITNG